MTRYHQFNAQYPEEARKIHQGNEEFGDIIWKAFARATFLHKFFPFSFTPDVIKDSIDNDKTDGTRDDHQ
jgi:hypothetical protein